MAEKQTPKPPAAMERDPFAIRTIEQFFELFNGGEFRTDFLHDSRDLRREMLEYAERYGSKGCEGSMTIKLKMAMTASGETGMSATCEVKPPKAPASMAHAYTDSEGNLSLHNPMMRRMHGGVRDAAEIDPETGEVRDI